MAKVAIGLELGFSRVKLVRLEKTKESVTLTHFDTENVTRGENIEETLQFLNDAVIAITKRNKLSGAVGVSFPSHAIFNRQIKMLPQPDAEIAKTISFEINEYLPFPVNEAVWGYFKAPRQYNPGEEYDIIIVAAKYDVMTQLEQALGKLIYKASIIQFVPLALYAYLRYEFAEENETSLILDIGETNTDMLVIEEGKLWHRNLTLSGKDVTKILVTKFQVDEAQANEMKKGELTAELKQALTPFIKNLASEINRSINFYKYTSKKAVIGQIKLCGRTSKLQGLDKMLQEATLIKTSVLDMPSNIYISPSIEETIKEEIHSLYPAIGLALQAGGLSELSLEFSPVYLKEYKEFAKKKPTAIVGIILLILAVTFAFFSFSKKTDSLTNEIEQMKEKVKDLTNTTERYNKQSVHLNKRHLLNNIFQLYSGKDKIIYLLDAFLKEIKKYNLTQSDPTNHIYLVGFDVYLDIAPESVKKPSLPATPPRKEEKVPSSKTPPSPAKEEEKSEQRNIQFNYYLTLSFATFSAPNKKELEDYTDTILRTLSRNDQVSFISKFLEIAAKNAKENKIKCRKGKSESGEGAEKVVQCSSPVFNCPSDRNQKFTRIDCPDIVIKQIDMEELLNFLEKGQPASQ
jgi:type IV pilus assembly protein PilM